MRRITQLPNNIRLITEELKDRHGTAIGIWVGTGGRYEEDRNKGVAHFLEHMAFKGSTNYSCDEIKQSIEGVGGNVNAFTAEEEICYYAKVPSRHWQRTFDVLADISFFPTISKKDLDKERGVILEEIKMYHDLPQYYVSELLDELLWPNHPLGKSITGSAATVSALQPKDLRDFHSQYYVPPNVVVSAAGQLEHDELVKLLRSKTSGLQTDHSSGNLMPARKDQDRPGLNLHFKQTEQMYMAIGYLAYEINHPDYYVLALLNVIIGGNMSSRLFNEVREKHGLAYSISSGTKTLHDTGLFTVRAGVDNGKITAALELILKVLTKTARTGITASEFKRAREYYLGQFTLGLEDTLDRMLWIGGILISNDKVKTVQEVIKKIDAVTMADIKRVARHILAAHRLNVAVIGPLSSVQEKSIRSIL